MHRNGALAHAVRRPPVCTAPPADAAGVSPSVGKVGIVHAHMHQETIECAPGQWIGPFLLDRVLRRHHQEQLGQVKGLAADRDLALPIASSRADCTLAGARLTSSAVRNYGTPALSKRKLPSCGR